MAFGVTLTLPTIVGGTHNDFRVLLKTADFPTAAIDGGTNSIANGGGPSRFYLDDTKTTPIPADVITFVTGGTPDILVRVRLPTAATGDTIYVEDDDVETSQPAFTASLGRNAVYPTATFATNQEEIDVADSSGNHTDGVDQGTVVNVASSLFGRANRFDDNSGTAIKVAGNLDLPSDFTQSVWIKSFDISGGFQGIIGDWGATGSENDSYLGLRSTNLFNWDGFTGSGNSRSGAVANEWQRWTVARSGTTVTISKNGVAQGATITDSAGSSTGNSFIYIGSLGDGDSNPFDGDIGHIELKTDNSTADYLLTEYDNQSSVGAWVTVGTWEDQTGGISVTGTAVPTQTETDVVAGGKTIILTLTGDTFVTGTSSEDGIAGGSDSDKTGANKWDALIKTALDNTDVVLSVGDTVATITLPAFATYDTDETETITWTIPAASLTTSTSDIIATPTHTVTAVVSGRVMGSLANNGGLAGMGGLSGRGGGLAG